MLLSERLGVNAATVHPNSRIAAALATQGVSKTPELMRVVGLPRRKFDVANYPDASILYARGSCGRINCTYCKSGGPSLRPIQNAILVEAAQNSGAFVAAGVGAGKTLASFLLYDALDSTTTVLLVPPSLRDKTLNTDLPDLQKHFKLPPIYASGDWEKDKPGVYVLGYSEISDTDNSDLLDQIKPDLIIADEVQSLKRKESARTRRFLRFMRSCPCRFVGMTGSPVSRSIKDFAHLVELALGKGSPLPADYPSLAQWADAIDNEGKEGATAIGALSLLCEDNESARDGFRRRFMETPGIIATEELSCDLPIEIREFICASPQLVQDALNKLEQEWAWDSEEYTNALDISRLQGQITRGYFKRIKWPSGKKTADDILWLEARNGWHRAIRARLKHSNRVGQDSPALLEALAESGVWTPGEWVSWLPHKARKEPAREVIEISQWLVDKAEIWSKLYTGIIWVGTPVLGNWLEARGIPYFGEGEDQALNAYAAACLRGDDTPRTIACSIWAHGTGKNLQAWSHNLVLYPPAQGAIWEQMIGRTHRPGQNADKVTVDVVLGSLTALNSWEQAKEDGKFIEQATGLKQRLNQATKVASAGDRRLG